jgi:2-C-methyl-D-erythritol 4-phosphate cytidylyltransferase
VVVVAAGEGLRFGGAVRKQYCEVLGVPLLLYAVRPFAAHPDVAHVVVVLPPEDAEAPPTWLAEIAGGRLEIVAGGAARSDSVAAGIGALSQECEVVLVHDGARPFPERGVIDAVIAAARRGVGAVAAVPLTDTVKTTASGSVPPLITGTVSRDGLWRAQTPQGFPRSVLENAYRLAGKDRGLATDDAAMVEATGTDVVIVRDTGRNFKVTTADDLVIAEALARQRVGR